MIQAKSARRRPRLAVPAFVAAIAILGSLHAASAQETTAPANPPVRSGRFESDIEKFEARDKVTPPPSDAALFVGSSSIRLWSTLAQDFPEIPVINRGFGGSDLTDSVTYADRIVIPYKPRIIVVYAGSNDLNAGHSPERVLADFKAFVAKVGAALPNTPIIYISINPSVSRAREFDDVVKTNGMIQAYVQGRPHLTFIDSFTPLLGPDGKAQASLLRADGLHLNTQGYKVWTVIVKPTILTVYRATAPVG